jgi:hypothetical protein
LAGGEAREIEAEILVEIFFVGIGDQADALAGNEAGHGGGGAALDRADALAAQEEADITSAGTVGESPDGESEDDRPGRPGGAPRSIQKSALSAGAGGA